jgi:hypothetical protein
LLAPSARIIQPGHVNFEPYVLASKRSHIYNKHWHTQHVPTFVSVQTQLQLKTGLCKDFDFQIAPTFSWNHSKGQARWVYNDLPIGINYQLVGNHHDSWLPQVKLSVGEIFPTGPYQKLDLRKNGTDAGGQGSFQTYVAITFGKLYHIYERIWLNLRLNASYIYLASVHVKGLNSYGGSDDTKGKVRPGQQWSQDFGMELSLSQNWALALDIFNWMGDKTTFHGRRGTMPRQSNVPAFLPVTPIFFDIVVPLTEANIGSPSFNQVSLAPAIEYNFSANHGIIAGAWFTVAGRNASDFTQIVIAYNMFY